MNMRRAAATLAVAASLAIAHSSGAQRPRVTHYDLQLDLPDTGALIHAVAALDVDGVRDSLRLDLVGMSVDSVLVNGRATAFARTDSAVVLSLGTLNAATVTVAYHGRPADGLIIRTDSAGRWTGFGDNWPNRARNWIASIDDPSEKATVRWRVRAPDARTVVANGALTGRRPVPGRAGWSETEYVESRAIAPYLMVIAAAPLTKYDLGETACGRASLGRCVPQMVYVAPEQQNVLPGAFAQAGNIVDFFGTLIAPFRYEKLAHLQSSTRYGGMENASAIFYADNIVRSGRMSEGLIAHETAHQWFGDAVTERTWPHVWLSEGFATYFAALWTQHAHGDSAFKAEMSRIRRAIVGDKVVASRPVIDTLQTDLMALLNRNSYEKGGFVLHMLRTQLGDSTFFRGLRRYYAAHVDGNATTDDLRDALEHESGKDLRAFFDQWLRRPGFAELDVTSKYDATSRRVTISVTQSSRFGAYALPLTIDVKDADGQTHRVTVDIPATATSTIGLPIRLATAPAAMAFDPDVQLLATIRTHGP